MECEELAENLTELMEGTLEESVEAAALDHLATCPACERVLAGTRTTVELLADHGRAELDAETRARLLGAIVEDARSSATE